jgi:hypothetical protein
MRSERGLPRIRVGVSRKIQVDSDGVGPGRREPERRVSDVWRRSGRICPISRNVAAEKRVRRWVRKTGERLIGIHPEFGLLKLKLLRFRWEI